MGTITVQIIGASGCVHSYKKLASETDYTDAGVTCGQVDMNVNIGDKFKFVAEPAFYTKFDKYCDVTNTVCITTPIFEGTVTETSGALKAYFSYNITVIIIIFIVLVIIGYLLYKYVV